MGCDPAQGQGLVADHRAGAARCARDEANVEGLVLRLALAGGDRVDVEVEGLQLDLDPPAARAQSAARQDKAGTLSYAEDLKG